MPAQNTAPRRTKATQDTAFSGSVCTVQVGQDVALPREPRPAGGCCAPSAAQRGQPRLHGLDVLLLVHRRRSAFGLGLWQCVCHFAGCFTQGPCKQPQIVSAGQLCLSVCPRAGPSSEQRSGTPSCTWSPRRGNTAACLSPAPVSTDLAAPAQASHGCWGAWCQLPPQSSRKGAAAH